MKTFPVDLDTLLATGVYRHVDLYVFTLQDATVLRYTTADTDVIWGGNIYTSKGPFFEDISSPSRGHWKAGLDLDSWTVNVMPAVVDPVTGAAYPATIYGQPWLVAARVGALDGATVNIHRAYWGDGVRQQTTALVQAGTGAHAELYDANHVFRSNTNDNDKGARSAASFSAGKWYCEIKSLLQFSVNRQAAGVGNINAVVNDALTASSYLGGAGSNGIGWWNTGEVILNEAVITTVAAWAAFDVYDLSLAIDADNKRIWFRVNGGNWNNSGAANPATNAGGIDFSAIAGPYYVWINIEKAPSVLAANFGASDYVYTPPTGFNNLINSTLDEAPTAQWPRQPRPTTWDASLMPAIPTSESGLSPDKLLFTSRTTDDEGARSVAAFSAGRLYCEFTLNQLTGIVGARAGVGLGSSDAVVPPNTWLGGPANRGIGLWDDGGVYRNSALAFDFGPSSSNGDLISMAVDADNKRVWFRRNGSNWNNDVSADPVTGAGSVDYSTIAAGPYYIWCDLENACQVTVNFGATSYRYAAPQGFFNLLDIPVSSPMAPDYVLENLFAGRVAEVDVSRTKAAIRINSMIELLQRPMPRNVYGSHCRHTLFDAGCALTRASFAVSGAVTARTDDGNFSTDLANAADYFALGMLTWTTGNNAPFSRGIRSYASPGGTIQLIAPMPYLIQVGDAFTAYPGCDKTINTCTGKFSNLANFGGFPFIPSAETAI